MLSTVMLFVAVVAVMLAVVWFFQRRLIYFPMSAPVPAAATILPAAEEVSFETEDGLRLAGWFVSPAGASRGTVLVFNGNAGDRSFRAPLAAALARGGLSVLVFDYRGYGRNPGDPSERGLSSDARAARSYLDSRPDVDPTQIAYFGESLGAAVAVSLAVERAPSALILRSPFTSLSDMGRVHYPLLPTGPLLRDHFDSMSRIGQVSSPVLIVAGERDQIVPPEQSRRLYAAILRPDARLVLISGADHNDFELLAGKQLVDEVIGFLDG
jgi:fermentation-respiration switch protein FrsA (DUF1100 family)